jgi:cell division protein FtsB
VKKKKKDINSNIKIAALVLALAVITVVFASYISNLLYNGKSSLSVYKALEKQKVLLEYNIKILQKDNARLQKEYFELKNLEPEE